MLKQIHKFGINFNQISTLYKLYLSVNVVDWREFIASKRETLIPSQLVAHDNMVHVASMPNTSSDDILRVKNKLVGFVSCAVRVEMGTVIVQRIF